MKKNKKIVSLTIIILLSLIVAVINIDLAKMSPYNNSWSMANMEAFAIDESGESGGSTGTLWIRSDHDCCYTFSGNAYATITILGGIKIKLNGAGQGSYTVSGGRTNCSINGQEQCTARYCPTIPGSSS
jgi:hypothetical protein